MNVQTLKPVRKWGLGASGLTPTMLNHAAWVTHDVAATADFYTRIMGMELASTIYDDHVPSTGEAFPYFHIFFRMGDGSTIAFFEVPGLPERAEPSHPAYRVFEHIALEAPDVEAVRQWKEWLVSNGVEVIGPVDHDEMLLSLYFYDPNGIRLEITTPTDAEWNRHTGQGYQDLEMWVAAKEKAVRENRSIPEALIELIREKKGR
ncbi:VOC family protein [Sphingomonas sp.]|uniref:VOC family protein n=1 Tax=Sphingomonas sp. TaxID=28214 RepID=UPI002FC834EA